MDNFFAEQPIGFSMELAKNMEAMKSFSAMSDAHQHQIVARAHDVHSKREMEQLVQSLVSKDSGNNIRDSYF